MSRPMPLRTVMSSWTGLILSGVVIGLAVSPCALSADDLPTSYKQVMARVQLVPSIPLSSRETEQKSGNEPSSDENGLSQAEGTIIDVTGRTVVAGPFDPDDPWGQRRPMLRLDPALSQLLGQNDFPNWKKYEDEFLSFEYPDDPKITLKILGAGDEVPNFGKVRKWKKGSTFRVYLLAAGEGNFCALSVETIGTFNGDYCMCCDRTLSKYLLWRGGLFRFDLNRSGYIEKIQIIGDGMLAAFFVQPHLMVSQKVYTEIALSVRLKRPIADPESFKQHFLSDTASSGREGLMNRLGFLELGMSKAQVVDLLGPPAREEATALTYVEAHAWDRSKDTAVIPIQEGVFRGFGSKWEVAWEENRKPEERGSLGWICDTAQAIAGGDLDDPETKTRDQSDAHFIFERFLEMAPEAKADGEASDWDVLCGAVRDLHNAGFQDKRVVAVVRKRLMTPKTPQVAASELLNQYDHEGSQGLFAQKLRQLLDETRQISDQFCEDEEERDYWRDDDGDYDSSTVRTEVVSSISNLFRFLDKAHPKRAGFVLEAMRHPCTGVRKEAYACVKDVPEAEVKPCVIGGLDDKNVEVRRMASDAFAQGLLGSKADLATLRQRAAAEADKETRDNLETAIARIEK